MFSTQMFSNPSTLPSTYADLENMQLFAASDALTIEGIEVPGLPDIGDSKHEDNLLDIGGLEVNVQQSASDTLEKFSDSNVIENAEFADEIQRIVADAVEKYFAQEFSGDPDIAVPSIEDPNETELDEVKDLGLSSPEMAEEELNRPLDFSYLDMLEKQDIQCHEEPFTLERDRRRLPQAFPDCVHGKLFKFAPDADLNTIKKQGCSAAVHIQLPSEDFTLTLYKGRFRADYLILETVRNGVMDAIVQPIKPNGRRVVKLDFQKEDAFAAVDTISVYCQRNGKVVKPLLSFYNTSKVHKMNLNTDLHSSVITFLFEIDAACNPHSANQVLCCILQGILWRQRNSNWHDKVPLTTGAWSYFKVTFQCSDLTFEGVYFALQMAIIHMLSTPEAYPEITGFPINLMFPHGSPNGPRLVGPLSIERVQRGPVLHC